MCGTLTHAQFLSGAQGAVFAYAVELAKPFHRGAVAFSYGAQGVAFAHFVVFSARTGGVFGVLGAAFFVTEQVAGDVQGVVDKFAELHATGVYPEKMF